MRKITASESNPVWKYRGTEKLPAGEYLILPVPASRDRALEKLLGVLHVTAAGLPYAQVLPMPLTLRQSVLLGQASGQWLPKELAGHVVGKANGRSLSLRKWQERLLNQIGNQFARGEKARYQINAGLGAGKTLFGLICAERLKSLVLCPPHLRKVWQDEAKKFDFPCPPFSTYESLKGDEEVDCLILDEVLKVKNPGSKRSQAAQKVAAHASIVLGLTGTPMAGKDWMDLRSVNAVVGEDLLPASDSEFTYTLAYEIKKVNHGSGSHNEVTGWNEDVISLLLERNMITVEISDLMRQIPDRIYEKVLCPTPKGYNSIVSGLCSKNRHEAVAQARTASDGFIYKDGEQEEGEIKREVEEMKDQPKLKELINQISKYQEMEPPEPVVVWVNWLGSQQMVKRELEKKFSVSCLFSSMSPAESGTEMEKFIRGETQVFVCSSALAEGMNLQEVCRIEIFFSNSLSPMKRSQAEGRVYRPGQKRQVQIVDLCCAGTLDERLLQLLQDHATESESFIEAELEKMLKGGKA